MAAAVAAPAMPGARRVRTVTPPILARWLEVKVDVVLAWIRTGDLPALNIGTRGKQARYRIFRKDVVAFLQHRGLSTDRIHELLGQ